VQVGIHTGVVVVDQRAHLRRNRRLCVTPYRPREGGR
jgi:hypothetical protein